MLKWAELQQIVFFSFFAFGFSVRQNERRVKDESCQISVAISKIHISMIHISMREDYAASNGFIVAIPRALECEIIIGS